MAWVKIPPDNNWWVCESGCYNSEENLNEVKCNHSSDRPVDGERYNAAHWQRLSPDENDPPHSFLCNYHYEEYVLGVTEPQDEPVESKSQEAKWPSAAEFELFMGEVK